MAKIGPITVQVDFADCVMINGEKRIVSLQDVVDWIIGHQAIHYPGMTVKLKSTPWKKEVRSIPSWKKEEPNGSE